MAKYVSYNNKVAQPVPVAAWYDSDVAAHIDFSGAEFIEASDAQWAARNDKIWAVSGPDIVEYVPPPQNVKVVQQRQIKVLYRACQALIVSGFTSSALGTTYNYSATATDQRNLILAAQSSKGGLLSCADQTSTWARVLHTKAQAQQVLEDFVAMADAARTQLSTLEAQIANATTVADVQAVIWEMSGG